MATKLKQLLDELTMLKEYFAQDLLVNGLTETVVLKEDLEELITKYTETTHTPESNESDNTNTCENCRFCYHCKDDYGRWVVCNNEKGIDYIKRIDHTFGCILFEPIN